MDNAARIRAVATRLFSQQGFDGTSLQSIASEVGIAKQSLLYHFASKEILRRAVLENLFEHWRRTLPLLLEAVSGGRERFDLLSEELIRFFREDPDRARLVVRELLDHPDEMRRLLAENLRPWILLVAEYVRLGKENGQIHSDVDAESYVLHVVQLAIGTVAHLPSVSAVLAPPGNGGEPAEERHVREMVRLIRSGLFRSGEWHHEVTKSTKRRNRNNSA